MGPGDAMVCQPLIGGFMRQSSFFLFRCEYAVMCYTVGSTGYPVFKISHPGRLNEHALEQIASAFGFNVVTKRKLQRDLLVKVKCVQWLDEQ